MGYAEESIPQGQRLHRQGTRFAGEPSPASLGEFLPSNAIGLDNNKEVGGVPGKK
jgi:hypothetical protein